MRRSREVSAVGAWAAGLAIGVTLGAAIPGSLLFKDSADIHSHSHQADDGQSWACPMLCVVLDSPGNCPVCGMELEPFQASGTEVVLSRHDQEMIGLTIGSVALRPLHTAIEATGRVEFDESGNYMVSAWTSGRVERLYVHSEGEMVNEGSILLEIYSPELFTAQQELLVVSEGSGVLGEGGVQAAREKLRLLGASDYQIENLLRTGEARAVFPVGSPASGIVTGVMVTQGEHVNRGQDLFAISDPSSIWLTAYLTEDQASNVAQGQSVSFSLDAVPGFSGSGTVESVVPFLNRPGGTSEVRISLDNRDGTLMPGQTAAVSFTSGETEPQLSVPRSSVLRLGERALVYVLTAPLVYSVNPDSSLDIEEVRFEPREVVIGALSMSDDGQLYYPVLHGLESGDVVALNGAFLIDSQAELTGLASLMNPEGRR